MDAMRLISIGSGHRHVGGQWVHRVALEGLRCGGRCSQPRLAAFVPYMFVHDSVGIYDPFVAAGSMVAIALQLELARRLSARPRDVSGVHARRPGSGQADRESRHRAAPRESAHARLAARGPRAPAGDLARPGCARARHRRMHVSAYATQPPGVHTRASEPSHDQRLLQRSVRQLGPRCPGRLGCHVGLPDTSRRHSGRLGGPFVRSSRAIALE